MLITAVADAKRGDQRLPAGIGGYWPAAEGGGGTGVLGRNARSSLITYANIAMNIKMTAIHKRQSLCALRQ